MSDIVRFAIVLIASALFCGAAAIWERRHRK
jgi:hypothetical protein